MSIMAKMWRERLFGSPQRPLRRRNCRPCLEQLEARLTPTTFYWTNDDHNNQWEDPNNWYHGRPAVMYPGWNGSQATTDDVAIFNGTHSDNCTMASAHTLAAINLFSDAQAGPYTGTVNVNATLTLSLGTSLMTCGTILQTAPIFISSLTSFTWTGGDINPTGTTKSFGVAQGGSAIFQNGSPGGKFGDALLNSGLVELHNSGTITLVLQAQFFNQSTGEIRVTTANPVGVVAATDSVLDILNSGLIDKQGTDNGTYGIDPPVSTTADTSQIVVQNGTLEFKQANITPANKIITQLLPPHTERPDGRSNS
jgi:hypothetical protein